MRARPTSSVLSALGIVGSVAACLGACSAPPAREEPGIDCAAGDGYDLWLIRPFDSDQSTWYSAPDDTGQVPCDDPSAIPGTAVPVPVQGTDDTVIRCDGPRRATATATVEPFADGPRCGGDYGLHLTASRNNDWGSLYGDYVSASADGEVDATGYEGVTFWARAEPGTERSMTLVLNDKYTYEIAPTIEAPDPPPSECVNYEGTTEVITDVPGQVGGSVTPGYVPPADACGNGHQVIFSVTDEWQMYFLPFSGFWQNATPNRRLEGIDKASIRLFMFRAPKDTILDIWIDDFGFYRTLD